MKPRNHAARLRAPGLRLTCAVLLVAGSLSLAACSKSASHYDGDEPGHEEETEAGAAFKEGRGLQLSPAIVKALGLKTADASERALQAEATLLAQVFAVRPAILASASLAESEAQHLEKYALVGARLVRIERATAQATRRVDAIFQLDRTPPPQLGDFVQLTVSGGSTTALAVPATALLETATGTYVYVINGGHYLRIPVKTGIRAGAFVEISDGLYAGDVVVASPVDQLWLAELRLTKGGGHSH